MSCAFRDKLEHFGTKKLKALLEKKHEDLNFMLSAMDSMCCAFLMLDKHGKPTYANKYASCILKNNKIPEAEHISEILGEEKLIETIEKVLSGENQAKINGELFETNFNPEVSHILLTMLPHLHENQIIGWLIVLMDYTLQEKQKQLEQRSVQLGSISQITSSIAHEIKNPLGAISIHLQLLEKKLQKITCRRTGTNVELYDSMANNIKVIEEEIENMNNVVGLLLNNLNINDSELLRQGLNQLIEGFIEFITPDLESRNITCTVVYEKNLPDVGISRPSITHVLLNLVKNAMEAMPEGGEITIRTYSRESKVYLSIMDTGVGVSEEDSDIIFSPYFTSKEDGSGIGLAISDRIMQMHHGEITFNPQYKKGAHFLLSFPACADENHLLAEQI